MGSRSISAEFDGIGGAPTVVTCGALAFGARPSIRVNFGGDVILDKPSPWGWYAPRMGFSWSFALWAVLALAAAYVALVIARAVQMHFELKAQLKAKGVEFAEKRRPSKTDAPAGPIAPMTAASGAAFEPDRDTDGHTRRGRK